MFLFYIENIVFIINFEFKYDIYTVFKLEALNSAIFSSSYIFWMSKKDQFLLAFRQIGKTDGNSGCI